MLLTAINFYKVWYKGCDIFGKRQTAQQMTKWYIQKWEDNENIIIWKKKSNPRSLHVKRQGQSSKLNKNKYSNEITSLATFASAAGGSCDTGVLLQKIRKHGYKYHISNLARHSLSGFDTVQPLKRLMAYLC